MEEKNQKKMLIVVSLSSKIRGDASLDLSLLGVLFFVM